MNSEIIKRINGILNHLQYNYGDDYAKRLAGEAQVLLNSHIHEMSFEFVINENLNVEQAFKHYVYSVERSLAKGLLEQAYKEDFKGPYGEIGKRYSIYLIKDSR